MTQNMTTTEREWKEKIDQAIAAAQKQANHTDKIVEVFVNDEFICHIHPDYCDYATSSGWLPSDRTE